MLRRSSSGRTTSLPPGLARARGEQGAALEAVRVDRRVPGRPVAAAEHGARARRGARHPAPAVVQVLKHAPLLGTGVEHVHCGAAADRQSGQAASPRGITGVCQGPDCTARWDLLLLLPRARWMARVGYLNRWAPHLLVLLIACTGAQQVCTYPGIWPPANTA